MKIKHKDNIRVEVVPNHNDCDSEEYIIDISNKIMSEIKDRILNVADLSIQWDTLETCSFCGHLWWENQLADSPLYKFLEPMCCRKAKDEFKKNEEENHLRYP